MSCVLLFFAPLLFGEPARCPPARVRMATCDLFDLDDLVDLFGFLWCASGVVARHPFLCAVETCLLHPLEFCVSGLCAIGVSFFYYNVKAGMMCL